MPKKKKRSAPKKHLAGQWAVVTGASSGLGEEYARQLAERGAHLIVVARRLDRLKALADELKAAHGVEVETHPLDLGAPGSARQLFELATRGGRRIQVLVNNAGIGPFAPFLHSQIGKHTDTIQLNTLALTELCHHFANHMVGHGQPSYVTNVGSIATFQGCTNFAVYSATKAYVGVFSEILRAELRGTNVSVTCLCPGGTYTEFSAANGQELKDSAHSMMMTAEAVVRAGVDAMFARKSFIVPGLMNKLAILAPKILPRGLALTIASLAMDRNVSVKALDGPKR